MDEEADAVVNIDTGLIRREETINAMMKIKNGKSGGIDGITDEVVKADMAISI